MDDHQTLKSVQGLTEPGLLTSKVKSTHESGYFFGEIILVPNIF
ncbi:MAG: hypothetical protein UU12_C0041G0004 [Candidatus Woesebacteria bacterium GW2011_GWA2_40_7b]|uniref:Uncharacterized protein n=1 Tax=Candidatus Woesebacteria bacterium GW2011_GWA2_40_7b TaxID=1618563 RepID=A0A0G0SXT3_9BACT|nr:MAG: hypothetical protein UU12_C0041G0004 [Candidatus Woesebacteria bacterium GW2011_GWA2_40_7b]